MGSGRSSGRSDRRRALPSPPGSGRRTCSPSRTSFSPASALRTTSMVSRIRVSGRANGTPWRPSITWGPDAPRPRLNRPSVIRWRVRAVMAVLAADRAPTWNTPEPNVIRSACWDNAAMGVAASPPQASATQQWSTPSRSASTTQSTRSGHGPASAASWMAVRMRGRPTSVTAPARRGSVGVRRPRRPWWPGVLLRPRSGPRSVIRTGRATGRMPGGRGPDGRPGRRRRGRRSASAP